MYNETVKIEAPTNGTVNYEQLVDAFDTLIAFTPRSMSLDQIRAALDAAIQNWTDNGDQESA